MLRKILNLSVIFCFFFTTLGPYPRALAGTVLGLPEPGTMVNLSPAYEPAIIKGLTVHKDNPFLFDFIVDVGQDRLSGEPLKKEGEKLIKYFLASLAIPDKDVWVNLSPYEKDRMIPEALGQTDMGRDLLEQDYILKQITASLIYPEKQLGKVFWDKVYSKAQAMYGTTKIPVNTFNKVWIMADRAEVFERNQTAFVVDSHLKVMLEEDYLALSKHQRQPGDMFQSEQQGTCPQAGCQASKGLNMKAPQGQPGHALASQIVKEIVLPELEKEVNTGKNFANLRQIFNSIILASWYKKDLQQALLNQVYADKSKVRGIDLNDPTVKQQIYEQYLKAYKKGVFNYIKEDINSANGETMPRKYFSGGINPAMAANPVMTTDIATLRGLEGQQLVNLRTGLEFGKKKSLPPEPVGFRNRGARDAAMTDDQTPRHLPQKTTEKRVIYQLRDQALNIVHEYFGARQKYFRLRLNDRLFHESVSPVKSVEFSEDRLSAIITFEDGSRVELILKDNNLTVNIVAEAKKISDILSLMEGNLYLLHAEKKIYVGRKNLLFNITGRYILKSGHSIFYNRDQITEEQIKGLLSSLRLSEAQIENLGIIYVVEDGTFHDTVVLGNNDKELLVEKRVLGALPFVSDAIERVTGLDYYAAIVINIEKGREDAAMTAMPIEIKIAAEIPKETRAVSLNDLKKQGFDAVVIDPNLGEITPGMINRVIEARMIPLLVIANNKPAAEIRALAKNAITQGKKIHPEYCFIGDSPDSVMSAIGFVRDEKLPVRNIVATLSPKQIREFVRKYGDRDALDGFTLYISIRSELVDEKLPLILPFKKGEAAAMRRIPGERFHREEPDIHADINDQVGSILRAINTPYGPRLTPIEEGDILMNMEHSIFFEKLNIDPRSEKLVFNVIYNAMEAAANDEEYAFTDEIKELGLNPEAVQKLTELMADVVRFIHNPSAIPDREYFDRQYGLVRVGIRNIVDAIVSLHQRAQQIEKIRAAEAKPIGPSTGRDGDAAMSVKPSIITPKELRAIADLTDLEAIGYYYERIKGLKAPYEGNGAAKMPDEIARQIAELQMLWEMRKGKLTDSLNDEAYDIIQSLQKMQDLLRRDLLPKYSEEITTQYFIDRHVLPHIKKNERKLRMLFGFSGTFASGKTTVADTVASQLKRLELSRVVRTLSFDDFLLQKEDRPDPNTEDPMVKFNFERFSRFIELLNQNERATKPVYDQTGKGQFKFGLDEDGQVTLFDGDRELVISFNSDGSIVYKLWKADRNKTGKRVGRTKMLWDGRVESGQGIEFKMGEEKSAVPIKFQNVNGVGCSISINGFMHVIQKHDESFYYEIDGEKPVVLSKDNQAELLEVWNPAEVKDGTKGEIIVVEGIGTLAAVEHFDLTADVNVSAHIRRVRSMLREWARGRRGGAIEDTHSETLTVREFTEDKVINRLDEEARKRRGRNNPNGPQTHFQISNMSLPEAIIRNYINRELTPSNMTRFAEDELDLPEIMAGIHQEQEDALIEWLKGYLAQRINHGEPLTNPIPFPGQSSLTENEINERYWGGNDRTLGLGRFLILKFVLSLNNRFGSLDDETLEDIRLLFLRVGGLFVGAKILDVSKQNIFADIDNRDKDKNFEKKRIKVQLKKVLLTNQLPYMEGVLADLGKKYIELKSAGRFPEAQAVLEEGQKWIDDFFKVQAEYWNRGVVDTSPFLARRYGKGFIHGKEVVLGLAHNSMRLDEGALRAVDTILRNETGSEFIQGLFSRYKDVPGLSQLKGFQLRFIGNSEYGEDYLHAIPPIFQSYYVAQVDQFVPVDRKELVSRRFGDKWRAAVNEGSDISFKNQGIALISMDARRIDYVSEIIDNHGFEKLVGDFVYQMSRRDLSKLKGTPRLQWSMSFKKILTNDSFDFLYSLVDTFSDLAVGNPAWLESLSPTDDDVEIIYDTVTAELTRRRAEAKESLPLLRPWQERMFKRFVAQMLEFPSEWNQMQGRDFKPVKKIDAAMTVSKMRLSDLGDVHGKIVVVREGYDVTLDGQGNLENPDDPRILESLPTIDDLTSRGAEVILAAHLGRPQEQIQKLLKDNTKMSEPEARTIVLRKMSLEPVAKRLKELLGEKFRAFKNENRTLTNARGDIDEMRPGQVMLLENLRFNDGEEANDPNFAKELFRGADAYVNDAPSNNHRAHASIVGAPADIPRVMGYLTEKEMGTLREVRENAKLAVIGGSKVSGKIGFIRQFLLRDPERRVLIGGAMANAFLKAEGINVQKSVGAEEPEVRIATELLEEFNQGSVKRILIPHDVMAVDILENPTQNEIINFRQGEHVPENWVIVDIGPETTTEYAQQIGPTTFWNGPMGAYDLLPDDASNGTSAIAMAIARAGGVVGGGDSVVAWYKESVLPRALREKSKAKILTGGGASLESLEGKILPGVEALSDAPKDAAMHAPIITQEIVLKGQEHPINIDSLPSQGKITVQSAGASNAVEVFKNSQNQMVVRNVGITPYPLHPQIPLKDGVAKRFYFYAFPSSQGEIPSIGAVEIEKNDSQIIIRSVDRQITINYQRKTDLAMKVGSQHSVPGGIDLNTSSGMHWKISKDGKGVEMNVDPAVIAQIKEHGIDSLSPVIFSITPITSIWPLMGLQAPGRNLQLAKT